MVDDQVLKEQKELKRIMKQIQRDIPVIDGENEFLSNRLIELECCLLPEELAMYDELKDNCKAYFEEISRNKNDINEIQRKCEGLDVNMDCADIVIWYD